MKRLINGILLAAVLCGSGALAETTRAESRSGGPVMCGGLVATIVGTMGDDIIVGTDGPDVIAGLAGNDVIYGGRFDDVICGGPGDDIIAGEKGEDLLFGDEGDDVLYGGTTTICCSDPESTGDDVLSGGPGKDELHTAALSQAGSSLYGDQGDDTIYIWTAGLAIGAQAHAYGGQGNDAIYQLTGDAEIDGGQGADLIVDWDDGAAEDEVIVMIGDRGDDQLVSEDETSTVHMDGGRGADVCQNGDTTTDCESTAPATVVAGAVGQDFYGWSDDAVARAAAWSSASRTGRGDWV